MNTGSDTSETNATNGTSVTNATNDGKILNLSVRWKRLWYADYSARYIRFKGDLTSYQKHLEVQVQQVGTTSENNWLTKALKLCEAARKNLEAIRIDEGWKLLHEAKRLEVYSNENFRRATIIQLREEAGKLKAWRSETIYKIIGFKEDKERTDKVSSEELEKALQIRDEHYHTLYYTNRLTRGQYNWLFFILVLLILLGLWYVSCSGITTVTKMNEMTVVNFLGILLFGLLGATTSSIFHFRNSQSSARVPEILSNNSITMSRIFVGAGFSVFIFVFLNSEIAQAIDVFNFKIENSYAFFTIAFVSGFSERLALNSIQKIIGKKE